MRSCTAISQKLDKNAQTFLNRNIKNEKICNKCALKLYNLKGLVVFPNSGNVECSTSSSSNPSQSVRSPSDEVSNDVHQDYLSEFFVRLGRSPVKKHKLSPPTYCQNQIEKVVEVTSNVLSVPAPTIIPVLNEYQPNHDEDEVIDNIKAAFEHEEVYENRIFLLSLLPAHWPIIKIMDKFQTTRHMVQKSKQPDIGAFLGQKKRDRKFLQK